MSVEAIPGYTVTAAPSMSWHTLTVEESFESLRTAPRGLAATEAARRLEEFGPNELQGGGPRLAVGDSARTVQERPDHHPALRDRRSRPSSATGSRPSPSRSSCSSRSCSASSRSTAPSAPSRLCARWPRPRRPCSATDASGAVPARELVPGDVVLLATGDKVPGRRAARSRPSTCRSRRPRSRASRPRSKSTLRPLEGDELPVGDRKNMAYAGTAVTYGRGRALVVATGMRHGVRQDRADARSGRDRQDAAAGEPRSGGQGAGARRRSWSWSSSSPSGLFRGQPFVEMLIFGMALAVAVVPEALPGGRHHLARPRRPADGQAQRARAPAAGGRDARQHVGHLLGQDGHADQGRDDRPADLRRRPDAGSLRHGLRAARSVLAERHRRSSRPNRCRCCCAPPRWRRTRASSGARPATWEVKGDPTEGALVVAAAKAGLDKTELDAQFPRVAEIPFTSETKRMTTLHETPDGVAAYAKGAPEVIVQSCARQLTERGRSAAGRRAPGGGAGSRAADGGRGAARAGGRVQTGTPRRKTPSRR